MSLVGLLQHRQERTASVHHTPHVAVDDPAQILDRLIRERTSSGHPGVVHQDLARTERALDLGRELAHALRITHIRDVHARPGAERTDQISGLLGAVGLHVDHCDRAPALGEGEAGRPADSAARSGDDRDASVEPLQRPEPVPSAPVARTQRVRL